MVATPVFKFIRHDTNEIFLISPIVHKKGSLVILDIYRLFEGVVILELMLKIFTDALRDEFQVIQV